MRTSLQTVKDEYNVNNVDATLSIKVSKLADMMNTFAIEACDKQKINCSCVAELYSLKVESSEARLMVLTAPLPKHLTQ